MPERHVLIVDDDPEFARNMARVLKQADLDSQFASCLSGARDALDKQNFGTVLLDLNLGLENGFDLLEHIGAEASAPAVIMLTGATSPKLAHEAIRHGATAFLTKPVSGDQLVVAIHAALETRRIRLENRNLRAALQRDRTEAGPVVAASPAMREVLAEARAVAEINAPVLIEGETGVGKEVVASYIHRLSPRQNGPFTAVNCGALPETLVDDEFFGHEAGAFTGANESRPGLIEVSDGGTLLLDEIGDITAPAQIRLLRVLEQRRVRRIGASHEIPVDVRILAATHRSLEAEVETGRFRADLFHRLMVIRLRVPALRERIDDIIPLAEYFLDRLASERDACIALGEDTHGLLRHYHWHGNVRELRNVIERAWFTARRSEAGTIHLKHLRFLQASQTSAANLAIPASSRWPLADGERVLPLSEVDLKQTAAVLAQTEGRRRDAAVLLGISERSLYRRINEHPDLQGLG
ncbi:MAG: sigma-54 dependent transcriptional regulator [Planctomycetota bacterium]|jgi:two-component system response regulator AtoC|nr:sigma-54 dependent transcriptional regulator [Planctomycetota bacterium]